MVRSNSLGHNQARGSPHSTKIAIDPEMVLGPFAETIGPRRAGAKPGFIKLQNNSVFGWEDCWKREGKDSTSPNPSLQRRGKDNDNLHWKK